MAAAENPAREREEEGENGRWAKSRGKAPSSFDGDVSVRNRADLRRDPSRNECEKPPPAIIPRPILSPSPLSLIVLLHREFLHGLRRFANVRALQVSYNSLNRLQVSFYEPVLLFQHILHVDLGHNLSRS